MSNMNIQLFVTDLDGTLLPTGRDVPAKNIEAVKRAVLGTVSPATPASILQLHQDATVIVDSAAASLLPEKFQHGTHEV